MISMFRYIEICEQVVLQLYGRGVCHVPMQLLDGDYCAHPQKSA